MKILRLLSVLLTMSALWGCGTPYEKGMKAYEEGKWQEAIKYFEDEDKWSDNAEAAEQMIYKASFAGGQEAFAAGKWDEAIEYFYRVKGDDYEKARELIGDVYFAKGQEAFEHQDWEGAVNSLILVRPTCSKYEEARNLTAQAKEHRQG